MKARLPKDSDSIQKYRFIYHFVPHETNRTRAKLLTQGAFVTYSLILVLLVIMLRILPILAPGILGYASNISTDDLLRYTNERRSKLGLKPLQLNHALSKAAERKAQDMYAYEYWAHVSPLGTKPWDFILSEGYDYTYAGENLAKNFYNSKEVVEAWYESPTHRENLLSANYDDIGFAIVNGVLEGYETTLVVQMFGRSRVPTQVAAANRLVDTGEEAVFEVVPPTVPEAVTSVEGETVKEIIEDKQLALLVSKEVVETKPAIDVRNVTRSITITFGGFITTLLGIDIWYSKRHGILKVTGHTLAHLVFLLVVIVSVMLSVFPGVIL